MTAFQIAKSVPAPNPFGKKYRGKNRGQIAVTSGRAAKIKK
jgi:hypothetical protein